MPRSVLFSLFLLTIGFSATAQRRTAAPYRFTEIHLSVYDDGFRYNATARPVENRPPVEYSLDGGPWLRGDRWGDTVRRAGTHTVRARVVGQPTVTISRTFETTENAPTGPRRPLPSLARMAADEPRSGLIQRVQPSKNLVYVPRIAVPLDSSKQSWNPAIFPEFRLARGDRAVYMAHQDLQRHAHALLRRGWTAVDGFAGKAPKDIPYTQRVEMVYENGLRGTPYGDQFASGNVPRGEQLQQVIDRLNGGGSRWYFTDQREAAELIYDIETWPKGGPEGPNWYPWFDVFRQAADQYRSRYGGNQLRAWACCVVGLDPGSVKRQSAYETTGYFKFNVGGKYLPYAANPERAQRYWHEHDFYVPQITQRIAEFRRQYPGQVIADLWAPYYEDFSSTDNGQAYRTYRQIRPDVAENAAVLYFINGASEVVAWASGENYYALPEQHFTRGLWRLAQLNDIREGAGLRLLRPRVSLDGGRTYQAQPELDFNRGNPTVWTHKRGGRTVEKEPFVYLLQSAAGTAILAIQPDQLDPTATRDVYVELPDGSHEPLRLYGRELCIVRTRRN
jgi:hypothetical protein